MSNFVQTGFVTHFHIGELNRCSTLSIQHVHIVIDGECKLRRARHKEKHSDKVRNQAMALSGGPIPGVIKRDCHACHGIGLAAAVPSINDRIKLCKVCNGLGYVLQKEEEHDTEIGELRRGAVLNECIPKADSLNDYEMLGCTPFNLLAVKLEAWSDFKYKWERLGTAQPPGVAATLAERMLDNAHSVRKALKVIFTSKLTLNISA